VSPQYLPYNQIDKTKWDACIDGASNGLIYGYSVYLDTMARHWDAIILNDYEVVMPLTWNKKYGICYLHQPFFTASLGLFGNNVTAEMVENFLMAIPRKFKYWDIYLNYGNRFHLRQFQFYDRVNYVLPLNKNYQKLFAGFRIGLKQSIKKAESLNCTILRNIDVSEVLDLAKAQGKKITTATPEDYQHLNKLYDNLYAHQKASTYGIYTSDGKLVASCILMFSHKRVYYILAGNHPTGRTMGASQLLINAFIKDYSEQDILLDFEGSDIASLAFFYSSFGAAPEMYVGLKVNKLPKLVQLLKP
jgi:hypothetical protein